MKDWRSGKYQISVLINEESALQEIEQLVDEPKVQMSIAKYRAKRSLNANALLWHCLGKIADALRADKWDIYLRMLRRYGQFTYICVKPQAVEAVKEQWRECEEIGTVDINGQEAVQLLCYFGSSTYNSKDFSVLLDGVISEMKEIGIQPPLPEDVKAVIETYEKHNIKQ